MGKDAVISNILLLPVDDQHDILQFLQRRLADDLVLDDAQELELNRRLDTIEKNGYQGRPWEEVVRELEAKVHARHPD